MKVNLLEQLAGVRWSVMTRTYGSSHSTLIGLLVDWWVSHGDTYAALEGGPTCGAPADVQPGQRGGQCDAILMRENISVAVVEVEGTRHNYTLDKLEQFFRSPLPDLQHLEFGVFLGYAIGPEGRGSSRGVGALPIERWTERACQITERRAHREIAVLGVEKTFDGCKSGPRARNIYYQCSTSRVHGVLIREGSVVAQQMLWPAGVPA